MKSPMLLIRMREEVYLRKQAGVSAQQCLTHTASLAAMSKT
jgi:hypothetical protein